MSKKILRFFLGVYVFLYIFNPTNFSDFNLIYIYSGIAILFAVFNINDYSSLLVNKKIFFYVLFLFYIISYLLIFSLSSGVDAIYRAYNYLLVLFSLVCSLFIVVSYSRLYTLSFEGFLKFLINIAVAQLFFVIIALVSPDFREWVLQTSRVDNLLSISNDYGGLRSYGLANGYTSTFPMLMGVYALIVITMVSRISVFNLRYYWLLFLSSLLIFTVIVNARIGLVPVVMFFVVIVLSMAFHVKSLTIGIKLFFTSIIGFIILISSGLDLDKYMTRLMWGIEEIVSLIDGERTGTFQVLEGMIHFPTETMSFLFGTGLSVFGEQGNFPVSSDIGFVRDIYMFGALNTMLLVIIIFYLTGPLRKFLKINFGLIAVFSLFIALAAYYFKGAIWSSSEIYNVILLLSVFSIYLKSSMAQYEKSFNN